MHYEILVMCGEVMNAAKAHEDRAIYTKPTRRKSQQFCTFQMLDETSEALTSERNEID